MNTLSPSTGRVAFICYHHPLETSPALKSAAQGFIKGGYSVDVYTDRPPAPSIESEYLRVIHCPSNLSVLTHKISKLSNKIQNKLSALTGIGLRGRIAAKALRPELALFGKQACQHLSQYDAIIAAEACSLYALALYAPQETLARTLYWSLELDAEMQAPDILSMMCTSLPLCRARAIADKRRRDALNIFLGQELPYLIIPVSTFRPEPTEDNSFFLKKYGIQNNALILLYSGYLCQWSGMLEFIQAFRNMPNNQEYNLVVQGRSQGEETYLKALQQAADGAQNIIIDPCFLEDREHASMVASASVGLAFYMHREDDPNFQHLANSSGKMATYLGHGIPVITNDNASMQELAEQTSSIICLHGFQGLSKALQAVRSQRTELAQEAIAFFDSNYNYSKYFKIVLDALGLEKGNDR